MIAPGRAASARPYHAVNVPPEPLVGLDEELGQVRDLLVQAHAGAGGARLVVGDAGIGKSSILARAAEIAGELGMRTLRATGVQ